MATAAYTGAGSEVRSLRTWLRTKDAMCFKNWPFVPPLQDMTKWARSLMLAAKGG